jgi:hypothetical protein
LDIAISPSSSTHVYTSAGSTFYATYDEGATAWKKVTHPGGGVTSIVVHPTEPKTVYTTNSGGNTKRVYKSIDGGLTWTNITGTGIPNDISVTSICYEKNTSEGLYIGTNVGVFYKNTSMAAWIYFGIGLPNAPITDVQISYAAKKIRVGTYGRGIWEANLYTSPVTDIDVATIESSTLKLYPNPFVDQIKIESPEQITSLRLFASNGHELPAPIIDAKSILQVGQLDKGVYTLEMSTSSGKKWVEKIIKE